MRRWFDFEKNTSDWAAYFNSPAIDIMIPPFVEDILVENNVDPNDIKIKRKYQDALEFPIDSLYDFDDYVYYVAKRELKKLLSSFIDDPKEMEYIEKQPWFENLLYEFVYDALFDFEGGVVEHNETEQHLAKILEYLGVDDLDPYKTAVFIHEKIINDPEVEEAWEAYKEDIQDMHLQAAKKLLDDLDFERA